MTGVTVTCVFVEGEYPYTVEYVYRLRDMVARWIDRAFQFVCLTDRPALLPDIETRVIAKLPGFAPWSKLELFNPARSWVGRMLYLDLDVLIVDALTPILDTPSRFAITSDLIGRQGKDGFGRRIVRRVNSSVMVWDGGTQTELYQQWTPAVADRLSGDQDWIGERLPQVTRLPRSWFPRLSELDGRPPSPPAKVVLAKMPKNHLAVDAYPWFGPLWGAA